MFLEHVHYNLEGHRRLALILSRYIQQQVLQREWDDARVPVDSEFDRLLGLLPEDRVSGLSYALRVMSVFPMSETFDVETHRSAIVMQIQQALLVLDTDQQQVFADLSLDDMAMRLPAAMADSFHRKQQPERELYYRRCDQIRQPWDPDATFRLGKCLSEFADRQPEAIEHCKRALQLNPQHLPAKELLERLAGSG